MPRPLAICIEDLEAQPGEPRYVRCVAVSGREPGLRLGTRGEVLWKSDEDASCELWVSADDRLILYRPEGAAAVTVSRAGRSLDVPYEKPVVLIDQDQIRVGSRNLRVHVHGEAPVVSAPSVLAPQKGALAGLARAAAVAATIGAAAVVGGCGKKGADSQAKPPVEVRDEPPKLEVAPDPPREKPTEEKQAPDDAVTPKSVEEIEVRIQPPEPPPPPPEEEPVEGKTPDGAAVPETPKKNRIEARTNPPRI